MCKMWIGSSLLIAGICKIQTGVQEQGPKSHDKLLLWLPLFMCFLCAADSLPSQSISCSSTLEDNHYEQGDGMRASYVLSLFSTIFSPIYAIVCASLTPRPLPSSVTWGMLKSGVDLVQISWHDVINVGSLVMKLACSTLITLKKENSYAVELANRLFLQ